ncbi:unnamed protein product [Adineta ricciae]|nr:unnamed protein product [Adineta ricciae]
MQVDILSTIIWLAVRRDDDRTVSESIRQLRTFIAPIHRFESVEDCFAYLWKSTAEKIVLVVHEQFTREISPQIKQLPYIVEIKVYDDNRTEEIEHLLKDFHSRDQIQLQHRIRINEPLPIKILNTDGQTSRAIDGGYLHFHRFIEVILQNETKVPERSDLIQYFREIYEKDKVNLHKVDQFEKTYHQQNCLKWYANEPFMYATLNQSLRTRNIELILLFGFFIRDLNEQLQLLAGEQPKTTLILYRGQWMSKTEVEQIERCQNQLISINSFFSTSLNPTVASLFLASTNNSDDRERVLFKMEVDPRVLNIKPFANISSISSFADEQEILFMTNSIFRVQSVASNKDKQIVIRLTLCSENEHNLKNVYARLCHGQSKGSLTLGDVLLDMGQAKLADRYSKWIFNQVKPNELSNYYNQCGMIAGHLGNHQLSIEHFQKALLNTDETDIVGCAQINHNMGIAYDELEDSTAALDCFNETLNRFRSLKKTEAYSDDIAQCFNSIGAYYADQNDYEKAVENFTAALDILREFCPHNYSDLALSYMNICNAYADLGQHTKKIEYYDRALELYKDSIPHDHPELLELYHNMTRTFEEASQYSEAIAALEKTRSVRLETLSFTDSCIVNIEKDIVRLKQEEAQDVHKQ